MKISEYVDELLSLAAEHGDLEVFQMSFEGAVPACSPRVAFKAILKGRERKPDFYRSYYHEEDRKGEKVVHV